MRRLSMRALPSLVLAVILSGPVHFSGQAQDATQSSDAEARRKSVRALADSLKRDGKVARVAPNDWKPSRTRWGDPAIEGVYTNIDEWGIPIQRPAEFAGRLLDSITPDEMAKIRQSRRDALLDRLANDAPAEPGTIGWYENLNVDNSRPWLIVDPPDGLVPALTPAGQRRARDEAEAAKTRAGRADSYLDQALYPRCITKGFPGSMIAEAYGSVYDIHQGRVVERFTSISTDTMRWSVTVDEPSTWLRPWTFENNLTKAEPGQQLYEYACHEGNYGMRNLLSTARALETQQGR